LEVEKMTASGGEDLQGAANLAEALLRDALGDDTGNTTESTSTED
jgi:hypothetical protein